MPQTNLTKAKENAKKIGVRVKPATNQNKKLDVFSKDGKKLATIGDKNYTDFLQTGDKQQQQRYKTRFQKTRNKVGTASYFADKILWK